VPAPVLRRARHHSRHGEAGAGPPLNQLEHFSPLTRVLKLTNVSTSPMEPPLAGTGSRGGHHRRLPVCPPPQQLLSPTEPANRTLVALGHSPTLPGRTPANPRRYFTGLRHPPPRGTQLQVLQSSQGLSRKVRASL
jgi:hypothetical protein